MTSQSEKENLPVEEYGTFPEHDPILPPGKREKYDYLTGIAEICKTMNKPVELNVGYSGFGTHCEYCGAFIKNLYMFVSNGVSEGPLHEDMRGQITVGSECAHVFGKYLDLPDYMLEQATKFFAQYKLLAKEAKVDPEAKIALKDLETKIKEMKLKAMGEKRKIVEAQDELVNRLCKAEDLLGAQISGWEKDFVISIVNQHGALYVLSPKQVEVCERIIKKASDPTWQKAAEEARKQRGAEISQLNEDRKLMGTLTSISVGLYDRKFVDSLAQWVREDKILTERQREAAKKLAEKYRKQIASRERMGQSW